MCAGFVRVERAQELAGGRVCPGRLQDRGLARPRHRLPRHRAHGGRQLPLLVLRHGLPGRQLGEGKLPLHAELDLRLQADRAHLR